LEWLAKQGKPRVWVSDAIVTGLSGHTTQLVAECVGICMNHAITRIRNLEEALKFLQTGKVPPRQHINPYEDYPDEDEDELV
jgi:hypothetical protein